ncbi:MAG: signal peptide peptidase SppA [Bacillota bacterium]
MFFPPPRRERSFTKAIFVTLASTIFGISLALNLYLLLFSSLLSTSAGTTFTEQIVVDGDASGKVAIIPIDGMITDETAATVRRLIRTIERDDTIKAVVVEVETPGGGVTPSDEIFHRLQALKKAKSDKNPSFQLVVSMGGLSTSGGYYLSAGADYIFAQPTTLTGNIGVLMPRFNLSGLMQKHGVNETTITAPENGFKNAGSMFSPESPKDTQYLQGIIDQAYNRFKGIVEKGRGAKLKAPIAEIANGKVYTGQEAKDNGLVDDIGYLDDAYNYAAKQAGLSNPMIVRFQRRPSLMEQFLANSNLPQPSASNINLQIDANLIDHLTSPRLLYLWRGE